eukprot:Opistho-1_new@61898
MAATTERTPLRQIITAKLARVVSDKDAGDGPIAHVDYHLHRGLLAACIGKVCCVWDSEWGLYHRFGRLEGSVHKARLRCCKFSKDGAHLITGGDDRRIIVWSVDEKRAETALSGHKDDVTCLKLSRDGDTLFSSAADGVVLAWDWRKGTCLGPIARHASSVRSFDLTLDGVRLACAQNDGRVDVWNLAEERRMDVIEPDAVWDPNEAMQRREGPIARGWIDGTSHHTGSICAVAMASNLRIIATASNDCTCKLWDVISYAKDSATIRRELQEAAEVDGNRLLNIATDELSTEFPDPRSNELRVGAVPVVAGYHADLLYTLKHEAPCYSLQFTLDARTIVTGSQDATCRIWSVASGDLLFQVNTPSSVTSLLYVEPLRTLFCSCGNRVLVLAVSRHTEARSLPSYWQRQQDQADAELLRSVATRAEPAADKRETSTSASPLPPAKDEYEMGGIAPSHIVDQSRILQADESQRHVGMFARHKEVRRSDLVRFLAHGTISAEFLAVMVLQFPGVSWVTLQRNMRACSFGPKALLRVLARSNYRAADLLRALSSPDDAVPLFDALKRGASIYTDMARRGFMPMGADEDADVVWVDSRPLLPPAATQIAPTHVPGPAANPAPRHVPAPPPPPPPQTAPLAPLARVLPVGRPLQQPRKGTICRYKPSEVMRLVVGQGGVAPAARNLPKHLAPLFGGGATLHGGTAARYNEPVHVQAAPRAALPQGIGAPPPSGRPLDRTAPAAEGDATATVPRGHEISYVAEGNQQQHDAHAAMDLHAGSGGWEEPRDHVTVRRQKMHHYGNRPAPGSAAYLAEELQRHTARYNDTVSPAKVVQPPLTTTARYEPTLAPVEAVFSQHAAMDSHAFAAAAEEEMRRALRPNPPAAPSEQSDTESPSVDSAGGAASPSRPERASRTPGAEEKSQSPTIIPGINVLVDANDQAQYQPIIIREDRNEDASEQIVVAGAVAAGKEVEEGSATAAAATPPAQETPMPAGITIGRKPASPSRRPSEISSPAPGSPQKRVSISEPPVEEPARAASTELPAASEVPAETLLEPVADVLEKAEAVGTEPRADGAAAKEENKGTSTPRRRASLSPKKQPKSGNGSRSSTASSPKSRRSAK